MPDLPINTTQRRTLLTGPEDSIVVEIVGKICRGCLRSTIPMSTNRSIDGKSRFFVLELSHVLGASHPLPTKGTHHIRGESTYKGRVLFDASRQKLGGTERTINLDSLHIHAVRQRVIIHRVEIFYIVVSIRRRGIHRGTYKARGSKVVVIQEEIRRNDIHVADIERNTRVLSAGQTTARRRRL
jgi:hypothetical protein